MYASTRQEELAMTGWPQEQVDAFLEMQFDAQHQHYHANYDDAEWDVILVDGEAAGRLYVSRWPKLIHILDIALLPEFRGRGIGTKLIGELIEEAEASGRPVGIHVEMNNPALTLYGRLGFTPVKQTGVYFELRRPPAS